MQVIDLTVVHFTSTAAKKHRRYCYSHVHECTFLNPEGLWPGSPLTHFLPVTVLHESHIIAICLRKM